MMLSGLEPAWAWASVWKGRWTEPSPGTVALLSTCTTTIGSPGQTLHRAREKFADMLLDEVIQSLDNPNRETLENELIELGLLEYCKPALERRAEEE